jgi:hypothetical protein
MKGRIGPMRLLGVLLLGLASMLLAPGAAVATSIHFTRIAQIDGGPNPLVPVARTPDGTLHMVYITKAATSGVDGLVLAPARREGRGSHR